MGLELQVNVAQLLKDSVGAAKTFVIDGQEPSVLDTDDGAVARVQGTLRLTRTDHGIWASGPVSFSVDYVCSRCLMPFVSWVEAKVDDVFLPSVDIDTGAKLRHDENEEAADTDIRSIDGQHVLDLTDALRQYRLAAVPLAPVCREDCKGICPECGVDLNEVTCSCEPYLDQRWAALRELLD